MWIKTQRCLVRMTDPHLVDASSPSPYKFKYKNGDKKDKYSTVHTTEYWSKRNPTVEPRWPCPKTIHQASALLAIDKFFLSRNRRRV